MQLEQEAPRQRLLPAGPVACRGQRAWSVFLAVTGLFVLAACPDQASDDDASVEASTTPSYSAPRIAVAPSALDYGEQVVGTAHDLAVEVQNEGDAALMFGAEVSAGTEAFALVDEVDSVEVAPGDSVEVVVRFTPGAPESFEGTLRITSNDEGQPELEVLLEGIGVPLDQDEDGFAEEEDCDDSNPTVYPGAAETCNGVDDDCDGEVDEGVVITFYRDSDGDGFGDPAFPSAPTCDPEEGYVVDATDCDDTDTAVNPGAEEVCNGIDDDCDGEVDGALATDQTEWYRDQDGDGFGTTGDTVMACEAPEGYVAVPGDCDDTNPAFHPGAEENDCADPNDYNCDGSVAYADADGDGFPACQECNDADAGAYPGAEEVCNGVDDDCDGYVDEGLEVVFHADNDGDGFGNPDERLEGLCEAPEGYVADNSDCNDVNPAIHPGADELCNGVDDDCDGEVDGAASVNQPDWYRDTDGDGYGVADDTVTACEAPEGYVATAGDCNDEDPNYHPGAPEEDCTDPNDYNCDGSVAYADLDEDGYPACEDCDDSTPEIHPGAEEACNELDDDCDGEIDEGVTAVFYADMDGDGFGDATASSEPGCDPPSGYVEDNTDCNDQNRQVFPGANEVCNGRDDDCDLEVDEEGALGCTAAYLDTDQDTWGGDIGVCVCSVTAGYATRPGDCDDENYLASPSQSEKCNGFDDDCDGEIDEVLAQGCSRLYHDEDQDGYGLSADSQCLCEATGAYTAATGGDCLDTDPEMFPGNLEVCDEKDNNCNGQVDEGVQSTYYYDGDGDGFGASYNSREACQAPDGYVSQGGDCNDYNSAISPGAEEACDEIDNNCNGAVDEGLPEITTYVDLDGDGHGARGTGGTEDCLRDTDGDGIGDAPPDGRSLVADDCDDSASTTYPGAPELCDGRLNDCNATVADYQCPRMCTGVWPYYAGVTSGYLLAAQMDDTNPFELVVQGAGRVTVLHSDGTLKWTQSASVQYSHPMVADMDLDGTMDVVLNESGRLRVLDGTNGAELENYSVTTSGWRPGLVFDLDNDGITDIVGSGNGSLSIVLRDGAGGAKAIHTITPPEDAYFSGDVAGLTDLDGDGIAEIVIGTGYSTCNSSGQPPCMGYVLVYDGATGDLKNDPETTFVVPDRENAYAGGTWPIFADLDADGELEVYHYFSNKVGSSGSLAWNYDGTPATPATTLGSFPRLAPIDGTGALLLDDRVTDVGGGVVDLDGDGTWEVVKMGSGGLQIMHAGTLMDGYPVNVPGTPPLLTDLNRDGRLDILFIGSDNASVNCYTLGEGTYDLNRFLANGSVDVLASGIYRTGGVDPFEPNDRAAIPFDPETSTSPIQDSRAFPLRGFLDKYSSSSGWSRAIRAMIGHRGDRDYYYAVGSQIYVTLEPLVGPADYDLYLHMYQWTGAAYEYITTWNSEEPGADLIYCHSSTPCPDEAHPGTKTFIIEVRPKDDDVDFGPWPYLLRIHWGAS